MRFRAPANVFLHRAQVVLILAALVPTILTTPIGIVLLASGGSSSVALVAGVLVLAFCASSLAGYVLGSIFLMRGASLVRVQNDFLSSVSHELRTPMTSIRMFVEALRDDRLVDADERARCLAVLHGEIVRLDALVARVLDLSRIEAGRQLFAREPIDVDRLVDAALAAMDAIQLGQGAQIERDVEPGIGVVGDRPALTQVLVNLLSNAWKYTGEDKRIRVTARASGAREVEVAVWDNGPGIPPDEQRRVFEKFERGAAARESGTSGSGLGLAIVDAIVRVHRGRVELQSSPKRGTCFRVFLPRCAPPQLAEDAS